VITDDGAGPGAAIETSGLGRDYGDVTALHPIDLSVPAGQRLALVGHNGSGKTTLIRMLAGLLDPSAGTADVAGNAAGSLEARAALSYLADQPIFYDDLSVLEHLEYVARLHGREQWTDAAEDLLERFALTDRGDHLPSTFSRGLKQKAAICLAFVRPFEVLVVDEPFVGLDNNGRDELLALFDDAHELGKTVLVATHELTTVAASERVLALRDGQVAYDGSPDTDLSALVDGS
jgi:ABC-type multidrug transport system ATPase subunit